MENLIIIYGVMLVYILLLVVPLWKIITKAGRKGVWSFVIFLPVLNIIFLWLFAFSKWPAQNISSSDKTHDQELN